MKEDEHITTPRHPAKVVLLSFPLENGRKVPIIQFNNPIRVCEGSGKEANIDSNVGFCSDYSRCGYLFNINSPRR